MAMAATSMKGATSSNVPEPTAMSRERLMARLMGPRLGGATSMTVRPCSSSMLDCHVTSSNRRGTTLIRTLAGSRRSISITQAGELWEKATSTRSTPLWAQIPGRSVIVPRGSPRGPAGTRWGRSSTKPTSSMSGQDFRRCAREEATAPDPTITTRDRSVPWCCMTWPTPARARGIRAVAGRLIRSTSTQPNFGQPRMR